MPKRFAGTRPATEGLWDWNLLTDRVHFSPRWLALIGCETQEIGRKPEGWLQRIHPEDRAQVLETIESARAERHEFDVPHRLRHKNGTYRWMSCRGLVERDSSGQAIRLTGWHSDVTAEEATDSVTGLPNGKLLLDRLAHSIERGIQQPGFRFALLLVDLGQAPPHLDNGLLTAAARRLETSLRTPPGESGVSFTDLVARLHDDRFAVLLDGLKDVAHGKVIGDRLLGEMLAPFSLNGGQVFIAPNIGIAVSASAYRQAEDMVRDAEAALHRARTLGGSRTEIFDTAILKSEQAEERLEIELKDALQRGEFRLFYQPIVALASNQIVGFEALVRWQHPSRGLLMPQDFIPMAERTGFIVPLGRWILREACFRLKEWQDRHAEACWMSVNLSAIQLKHPPLVEEIGAALEDAALRPGSLAVELTESIAMEDPGAVKTLLMRLRVLGVRVSIDDFGTGYSSLAHLRQFPVDTLKIDRSFVHGTGADTDTLAILGTMIAMAQQLGLHVIVEGVENDGQLAMLQSLRCEAVQGYLFARALDADAAESVLMNGLTAAAGRHEPSAPAHASEWPVAAGGSARRQWLAGAATLAVLMSAGVALVTHDFNPARRAAASRDREARTTASGNDGIQRNESPAAGDSRPLAPGAAKNATAPRSGDPVSKPNDTTPPDELTPVSLKVVHLHQFGNCAGRLTISVEGIEFAPDERTKDAFQLPHGEFMQSMLGDTLTVKSAAKTYKFRTSAAHKNDKGASLRSFAGSIPRFRQASTSF